MAYIPPHKRHSSSSSSSSSSPLPSPSPPPPRFINSSKIINGKDSIYKWFPVGLSADHDASQLFSMTHLEPLSLDTFDTKTEAQKPLVLVLNDPAIKEGVEGIRKFSADPWNFVAENVKQDLLSSFERVKNEMVENEIEEVKPKLVARIGKVLFHRGSSSSQEAIARDSLAESTLRKLKRSFYTNVPPSYVDYVINEEVQKFGLCLKSEKDLYQVKLSDNERHDSTLNCKCTVGKDHKTLELHKVELNTVRHLVADVSCLDKKLDLRLMLSTKRIMTALTDDEIQIIKRLISYASLDPEVKGGLRWPLGKDFSGDRYAVVGVCHSTAKSFVSSSIRIKVRQVDRFDFRSSTGEDTGEVTLRMRGIVSQLREQAVQHELVSTLLKDNLRLIWEHLLK